MSLYGCQNVMSIALRKRGERIEILYLNILRTRLEAKGLFLPENQTLILNRECLPGDCWAPEYVNGIWVPFSDTQKILLALYGAIVPF